MSVNERETESKGESRSSRVGLAVFLGVVIVVLLFLSPFLLRYGVAPLVNSVRGGGGSTSTSTGSPEEILDQLLEYRVVERPAGAYGNATIITVTVDAEKINMRLVRELKGYIGNVYGVDTYVVEGAYWYLASRGDCNQTLEKIRQLYGNTIYKWLQGHREDYCRAVKDYYTAKYTNNTPPPDPALIFTILDNITRKTAEKYWEKYGEKKPLNLVYILRFRDDGRIEIKYWDINTDAGMLDYIKQVMSLENNSSLLLILTEEIYKIYWHDLFYKLQENHVPWIMIWGDAFGLNKNDKTLIMRFNDEFSLFYTMTFKNVIYHNYTEIRRPYITGALFYKGKPVAVTVNMPRYARVEPVNIARLIDMAIELAKEDSNK